ncbi:MAG: RHS repeat-associated core domain-containing protein, partial [Fibrobacter sp.]|nr:RHS repeat-associated core domain-containing protein [Fibrobacter sp.]
MLCDDEGTVTDRYTYDAFGNLTEKIGLTENSYLYCGEQYDSFTGLYYLRARYMSPTTGTFITMDEYAGSVFEPVSLHKYLYANANPVMYCDPSGYFATHFDYQTGEVGYSIVAPTENMYNSVVIRVGYDLANMAKALVVATTMVVIKNTLLKLSYRNASGFTVDTKAILEQLFEEYAPAITLAVTYANAIKAYVKATAKVLEPDKEYGDNSVYVLKNSEE